jgi:23S rRNA pseudouridine2604 synthase
LASERITINGQIARIGDRVTTNDTVKMDDCVLTLPQEAILYAYYKPVGVTCTMQDAHAKQSIKQALAPLFQEVGYLSYAGRLDQDSEGLMILTNDGDLVQTMMSPQNYHEKEYYVTVDHALTPSFLREMAAGVVIEEDQPPTRPCKILPDSKRSFYITLTQGRNRQIRRMCEMLGYEVRTLCRKRILCIELGDLTPGAYKPLSEQEKKTLYEQVYQAKK